MSWPDNTYTLWNAHIKKVAFLYFIYIPLKSTPGATVRHTMHPDRLWPPCCTIELVKAVPSSLRSWLVLLTFYSVSTPSLLYLVSLYFTLFFNGMT